METVMDLSTSYLGLSLKHPVVASASPLSRTADGVRQLEDAGAAAVVMASIYEEEIAAEDVAHSLLIERGSYAQPEAAGYFPQSLGYAGSLGSHLETVRRAAGAVDIPVIASLNGSTREGWVEFARELEDAGASAIELNVYRVPADSSEAGETVERGYVEIVRAVREVVGVPISVKLGPYFSSPGHMAKRLVDAGADGLVLFNRFYEPDIDLATLTMRADLNLSNPYEIRLPLMWIALLHGKLGASLAATTGVDGPDEAVKYLLAGADIVMTASALLRHGPAHIGTIVRGIEAWLAERGFASVDEARGRLSGQRLADPEAMVRAQYIKILTGYR
jgi:dihydroorotate dehydrogenase (fumarate)